MSESSSDREHAAAEAGTETTDTGRFFDREAEHYDGAHDSDDPRNPLHVRLAAVRGLLGPTRGAVLDCGMGPGRLLAALDEEGWRVSGVDVSAEMVARARARLPARADHLVQASIEELPCPSESFDAVVATGVLEYVEDVPRALAEVHRVLSSGGLFVLSMPNPASVRIIWRHKAVYPVWRVLKARIRFTRPAPRPRPGWAALRHLPDLLAAARLDTEAVEYLLISPTALRALSPARGVRALLRRRISNQIVVAARKAGGQALPASGSTVR